MDKQPGNKTQRKVFLTLTSESGMKVWNKNLHTHVLLIKTQHTTIYLLKITVNSFYFLEYSDASFVLL